MTAILNAEPPPTCPEHALALSRYMSAGDILINETPSHPTDYLGFAVPGGMRWQF